MKEKENQLELDQDGRTEEEFLARYDVDDYERPSVTNDILIFATEDLKEENVRKIPRKGLQVLLIKRTEHPCINQYGIPGGFIAMDESLGEGAYRKMREETGIEDLYIEQLYTFGEVDRDPRTRVVTVSNMALVPKKELLRKGYGQYESTWFWVEKKEVRKEKTEHEFIKQYELCLESEDQSIRMIYEVTERIEKTSLRKKSVSYQLSEKSNAKLAFDHEQIIDYGIERLRNKVEYTPIAVYFLPKLFTVKELQYVYEAILGKEVLNFRRKIGSMIVETDEKIEGRPYRPAQMFRFNEEWEHEF